MDYLDRVINSMSGMPQGPTDYYKKKEENDQAKEQVIDNHQAWAKAQEERDNG